MPAFGLRLLQYTPAWLYMHAARYKVLLGKAGWLHGPALFQTMQLTDWVRPPGQWLAEQPALCAPGQRLSEL